MATHENDHYKAFEQSQLHRDDLMDLSDLQQRVDTFNTKNNNSELKQHIDTELTKWKEYVRDHYKPEAPAEQSRLSNIADKVQSDINTAFEYNDGAKIFAFLEASYQRSKEDLTYGRTLILFSEKDTIKRALTFFDSEEDNRELADFIISKNIEIGKEIMSKDYIMLLEIERDFINARFK